MSSRRVSSMPEAFLKTGLSASARCVLSATAPGLRLPTPHVGFAFRTAWGLAPQSGGSGRGLGQQGAEDGRLMMGRSPLAPQLSGGHCLSPSDSMGLSGKCWNFVA